MIASPGRSPRPARPTAWARSWYVRSAARSSGRFRATSGGHDADERHGRDVEALRDEARPDEDVEARRRRTRRSTRSAAPRRSTTSRSSRPTRSAGNRRRTSSLDALRAAAEVADPRRAAVRAAGRDRRRPAAVMAAQRRPGLVVDERPLALRAGLDVAAVAAQDDRRGPAPVDDVGSPGRRPSRSRAASASTRRRDRSPRLPAVELLAQVDDLDDGRARRSAASAGRPAGSGPSARPADALDRRRRAAEDDRRAGELGRAGSPTSRAWSRGVRSLL